MYGIVNKAIEELVCEHFGKDKWDAVLTRSGVNIDFFVSNEPYDDEVTYKLAQAASDELGISLEQVLIAFGEFWVLSTGQKKYGEMLASGGNNLRDFIINMPNFHNRISLMYPNLAPPEFMISDITDVSMNLHYFSHRKGLRDFVRGLLQGLSKLYKEEITITHIESGSDEKIHEVFRLDWV